MKLLVQPPPGSPPGIYRSGEPVRLGVPIARGRCADARTLRLTGPSGPVALQARPLDRWPDGSIRWALLDFLADHDGGAAPTAYDVTIDTPAEDASTLAVVRAGAAVTVDTGRLRVVVGPSDIGLFDTIVVDGCVRFDAAGIGLRVRDGDDRECRVVIRQVDVEEAGPVTAVLRLEGEARRHDGGQLIQVVVRLQLAAGSTTIRIAVTARNPRAARHPGGIWELGDAGSVHLRDLSFVTAVADTGDVTRRCSAEPDRPVEDCGAAMQLWQQSSGGEQWDAPTHVNARGEVVLPGRGYVLSCGGDDRRGVRATPMASLHAGETTVAIAMPEFWQNFPKAIESEADTLTLRLFPRQHPDLHELQGGEQKTHVFYVAFGLDHVTAVPLDWARFPLAARATARDYCASGAVPYLQPMEEEPSAGYRRLLEAGLEGPDAFVQKRERADEYGWRHWGDISADHEAVFHREPGLFVSHYNNQYDSIAGFAVQFMRSGDLRWWQLCTALAAHVADIDVYHTDRDKAAYNGGLFWHTYHYRPAGRATHRAFPRAPGIAGGGPSPEHNYSSGLLLHYYLTGDPLSRESVLNLAAWVVAMDDGRRTPFRFLAGGASGVASATGSPDYHGPGRGAGNSIAVLLDGTRLTGDDAYARKAEALIRRCIHPDDDIEGRRLLDVERRWSYTVFLQALGRYLHWKAERGEVDAAYAYARASLLAYAAWMARHERPYLDHPEDLEYPTETWAAQELWKSEVFLHAAAHADEVARTGYRERARFFCEYAVDALAGMPTRALARPLALLMSHGYMHGYSLRYPETLAAPPAPAADFGRPLTFEPQKARARRRAMIVAAMAAATVVIAVAWLIA